MISSKLFAVLVVIGGAIAQQVEYRIASVGQRLTNEQRLFLTDSDGRALSPLHDIKLYVKGDYDAGIVRMITEVGRGLNSKWSIADSEPLTPMKRSLNKKSGKPKLVGNLFPMTGYPANYGSLVRTEGLDMRNGLEASEDEYPIEDGPLDIFEIGTPRLATGSIVEVKPLGAIATIDGDEIDWKIIGMNATEALARNISTISCVEKAMPGLIPNILRWLRLYKTMRTPPRDPGRFAASYDDIMHDPEHVKALVRASHVNYRERFDAAAAVARPEACSGEKGAYCALLSADLSDDELAQLLQGAEEVVDAGDAIVDDACARDNDKMRVDGFFYSEL